MKALAAICLCLLCGMSVAVDFISPDGNPAIFGKSYTKNMAGSYRMGTIGVAGHAESSNINYAYGVYGEARLLPGGLYAQAAEFDVINLKGSPSPITPANPNSSGVNGTVGITVSAGRSDLSPNYPVSAGISIYDNGAQFQRGIVIGQNAIAPLPGYKYVGIQVGWNQRISWYNDDTYIAASSGGKQTDSILIAFPNTAGDVLLEITPTGIYYTNANHGRKLVIQ